MGTQPAATVAKKARTKVRKEARKVDYDKVSVAQSVASMLLKTEVMKIDCDYYHWRFLTLHNECCQAKLAEMLAECCVHHGFVPDILLKSSEDKTSFVDYVSGKLSLLLTKGIMDGVRQNRLCLHDIVIDPLSARASLRLSCDVVMYASYEMPTPEEMAAIENYVKELGAEAICFGSVVGSKKQQSPTRFSLFQF